MDRLEKSCALTNLEFPQRVLALVHTPLDIVGGFAAALVGVLWYGMRRRRTS